MRGMAARVPDILLKIPLRGMEISRSGTQWGYEHSGKDGEEFRWGNPPLISSLTG